MKVAIHQPSYAAWCGYFAKIRAADRFIFLDDAQMCKNNVINRNKIIVQSQTKWLTVPVSFSLGDPILDVAFADSTWQQRHRALLTTAYAQCPYFAEVMDQLGDVYRQVYMNLADLNIEMTLAILRYLGIQRDWHRSSDLACPGINDDRLVALVGAVGGDTYLSGPGGMRYQEPVKFSAAGIRLVVKTYTQIPYRQLAVPFQPNMSILDALFNLGRQTLDLLRYEAQALLSQQELATDELAMR